MKLHKPKATVRKKAARKSKTPNGKIIIEDTVEPLADWVVGFQVIEDPNRTTEHNPDGRFVRFTSNIQWMPERAMNVALAHHAIVEKVYD